MVIHGIPVNTQHRWSTLKKLMWQKLHGGSPLPWKVFTGNPVQFNAPKAHRLKSVEVNFEPIQDLHGYDSPWPAGGGTNIIPDGTDTSNGFMADNYLKADGITVGSTAYNVSEYFPVEPSSNYVVAKYNTGMAAIVVSICFYDANKAYLSGEAFNNRENFVVTTPSNAAFARCTIDSASANQKCLFLVAKGSTVPSSWTPYSNICPISGWTGMDIIRAEANLCDEKAYRGYMSSNNVYIRSATPVTSPQTMPQNFEGIVFAVKVKAGTEYTFSSNVTGATDRFYWSIYESIDDAVAPVQSGKLLEKGWTLATFTPSVSGVCLLLKYSSQNDSVTWTYAMANLGSTALPYAPYTGKTTTLTFGQTVFGGTASVVEDGTATGTDGWGEPIDMGTLEWKYDPGRSGYFWTELPTKKNDGNIKCSVYNYNGLRPSLYSNAEIGIYEESRNNGYIDIRDPQYGSDINAFKSAITGQMIQFELATPVPFTPTASSTPTAVQGINTMWSDANGDLEVEAQANEVPSNSSQSFSLGSPLSVDDTALNGDTALWHEDDYSDSGLLTEE